METTLDSISNWVLKASPYVFAAWGVWGFSNDFIKRIAGDGDAALQKYVNDQIDRLKTFDRALREWEKQA